MPHKLYDCPGGAGIEMEPCIRGADGVLSLSISSDCRSSERLGAAAELEPPIQAADGVPPWALGRQGLRMLTALAGAGLRLMPDYY